MDNVLVDFPSGIAKVSQEDLRRYEGHLDDVPGIGPATRKKLLRELGSLRGVREASLQDITAVVGEAPENEETPDFSSQVVSVSEDSLVDAVVDAAEDVADDDAAGAPVEVPAADVNTIVVASSAPVVIVTSVKAV